MSILSALLGTKTNKTQRDANGQQNAYLQAVGQGNSDQLTGYTDLARQARQQYTTSASDVLNNTTGAAKNELMDYGGQAQSALMSGLNSAVSTATGSNAAFQPYVASGTAANNLYADSLGLNGSAGNQAATNAFQAGPGYQYQVDQATDNAARKAASLGMAGSGNTLDAITRLSSNLANQEYGGWQDRLNGLSSQGLTAATAISGNNAQAAGYQYGAGTTGAQLLQQLDTNLGAADVNLGSKQANLFDNLGNSLADDQTTLAQRLVGNNTDIAKIVAGNNMNTAASTDATTNANNSIYASGFQSILDGLEGTATGKSLITGFSKL